MFEPKTIEDIARKELELDKRRRARAAELAAEELAAGEAYLSGEGAGALDGVIRLRAELDALGRAIDRLRTTRPEIIIAGFRERAKVARAEMAKKRSQLAALNEKTAKHLAAISELQGVEYPLALLSANGQLGQFGNPRSAQLESEVAQLENQANSLEGAAVPDSGQYAYDEDAPIANETVALAILTNPTMGPSANAVTDWLARIAAEVQRRCNVVPSELEALPRVIRLSWKDGRIDEAASYVYVPSLAPRLPSVTGYGHGGYDVARGAFKVIGAE